MLSPAAVGDWELVAAFVLRWVSSPHWGLGSCSGKVYLGKTNKSPSARPDSVVSVSAPLLPAVGCCGEAVEPSVWEVGTENCQDLSTCPMCCDLVQLVTVLGNVCVPCPQRWHWKARFSSGTLGPCCFLQGVNVNCLQCHFFESRVAWACEHSQLALWQMIWVRAV